MWTNRSGCFCHQHNSISQFDQKFHHDPRRWRRNLAVRYDLYRSTLWYNSQQRLPDQRLIDLNSYFESAHVKNNIRITKSNDVWLSWRVPFFHVNTFLLHPGLTTSRISVYAHSSSLSWQYFASWSDHYRQSHAPESWYNCHNRPIMGKHASTVESQRSDWCRERVE